MRYVRSRVPLSLQRKDSDSSLLVDIVYFYFNSFRFFFAPMIWIFFVFDGFLRLNLKFSVLYLFSSWHTFFLLKNEGAQCVCINFFYFCADFHWFLLFFSQKATLRMILWAVLLKRFFKKRWEKNEDASTCQATSPWTPCMCTTRIAECWWFHESLCDDNLQDADFWVYESYQTTRCIHIAKSGQLIMR